MTNYRKYKTRLKFSRNDSKLLNLLILSFNAPDYFLKTYIMTIALKMDDKVINSCFSEGFYVTS
jgi:hypothetical protein